MAYAAHTEMRAAARLRNPSPPSAAFNDGR